MENTVIHPAYPPDGKKYIKLPDRENRAESQADLQNIRITKADGKSHRPLQ